MSLKYAKDRIRHARIYDRLEELEKQKRIQKYLVSSADEQANYNAVARLPCNQSR